MNESGLGRPGAQNESFLYKALIKKWIDPRPDGQDLQMKIVK